MTDYTPTAEQIDALESEVVMIRDAHPRRHDDVASIDLVEQMVESPAFQAIVRAAQAEAWEGGYSSGHWAGIAWARSAAFEKVANPYEEAADV